MSDLRVQLSFAMEGDEAGGHGALPGRAWDGLFLPRLQRVVATNRKLLERLLRVPRPEQRHMLLEGRSLENCGAGVRGVLCMERP